MEKDNIGSIKAHLSIFKLRNQQYIDSLNEFIASINPMYIGKTYQVNDMGCLSTNKFYGVIITIHIQGLQIVGGIPHICFKTTDGKIQSTIALSVFSRLLQNNQIEEL